MSLALSTNLADIPVLCFQLLSNCLNTNDLWMLLLDDDPNSAYFMGPEDIDRYSRLPNPGEAVVRCWGNRGQTVLGFLGRLQKLSAIHGSSMDKPQLIMNRKFKPVRFASSTQVIVSITSDGNELSLECKAVGFPSPKFQWFDGEDQLDDTALSTLIVPRCKCVLERSYWCQIRNEVPVGYSYSDFYRKPGKEYASQLNTDPVDLNSFINPEHCCPQCKQKEYARLCALMGHMNDDDDEPASRPVQEDETETLVAADKVALIISNSRYRHLPPLVTPHCDAETLAQGLQALKFKTVTLADLTLVELRHLIKEYKKLLGNGVYAVFYFVGHGFEVGGECFLLPVEAPADAQHPEHSLSMLWILDQFKSVTPALNLILLDVCRKYIPYDSTLAFMQYADQYKTKVTVSRNTVYGYSTSAGVSAYEVRGEVNGVFMKYLQHHVTLPVSVVDMINRVLRDIENDERVRGVQVPELRSTLARPRSLTDALVCDGHTVSFDHHTLHWRLMHELPNPVHVKFPEQKLTVTVWFDFCGHFTNKVYVFSSVGDLASNDSDEFDEEKQLSPQALSHLAYLNFPPELETSSPKMFSDDEEGISLCVLLSNLQRSQGEVRCRVSLRHKDRESEEVAGADALLGHVLITRLDLPK